MPARSLPALMERIVVAGVGLTSRALIGATPRADLTFPQWRVIVVLGEREDGATLSEVAGRVGVTLPATSRQLRRLARRGLVEIAPDPDDRRASRARLTTTGAEVRHAIVEFRRSQIRALTRPMKISATTLAELNSIADALDGIPLIADPSRRNQGWAGQGPPARDRGNEAGREAAGRRAGQVAAEAVRPACGVRLAPDMEDVTRAKLQIRLVVVTFRQHLNRMPTDAAEAFRARALPILESVDVLYGDDPDVAQLLAEARGELDGAGH